MEGKLRILMINNTKDENPSYVMRNKIVGEHLEKLGHDVYYDVQSFSIDFEEYDVFIFSRFYEGTLLKYIQFLKKIGKTVIYETDDNYESIDENNPYMRIKDYGVLSSRELITLAHGVTVSTPELKAEILKMFPSAKVFVVPNALNFSQYRKRNGGNKKVKVGFQGSNIHVQDLLIVIDAIKELKSEIDFDFEIFGIDNKSFKKLNKFCLEYKNKFKWMNDFPVLYKKLSEIKYKHIKNVSYDKYRKKLTELNWDIGIAPLTDTRFNRSKSCLKFYEYVAVGTVTLASDVVPYNVEMKQADIAKNRHSKWKAKLRRLIVDEKYRQERLYDQENFVHNHRDIKEISKHWENVISLIKKNG
jgi:hypothetical protein